jgi:hypothetical protein
MTREWVCPLQLLQVLASTVILGSEFHRTPDQILLSHMQDSPNLEGQVPIFMCPRNRVAKLYPQTVGSLFVIFYDSQGMVCTETSLTLFYVLSLPGKRVHRAVP